MKIKEAIFSGSSQKLSDRPKQKAPEFAFIGRSNVGKSSLINMLCNQAGLAHTSAKPGKTQLINHFLINKEWYLVDLPGYGYAKLSKTAIQKLDNIIRNYVNTSAELTLLFVLIDSRHNLQKADLEFLIKLGEAGIPFAIIFTKTDKLKVSELENNINSIKEEILNYWEELPPCIVSSSVTKAGKDEILELIETTLKNIK